MLFRSMPSWTISHSGLMDTERKSSDKPANPIRTQLKTGSSWPHLPQSGHMVDTFLCCVVHLFFCGEPANTKPTKYKEAEKGWQKKTLGLDSTENVCVVAESFHNQQSYGSWWEERGPLMAAAAAEFDYTFSSLQRQQDHFWNTSVCKLSSHVSWR